MAAGRLRQLTLLLWKNWLFSIRSWKATLLQLFAPCFFLILVTGLSYLPQGLQDLPDPPTESVGYLPKCTPWNHQTCSSLVALTLYSGETPDPCVNELLERFSKTTGMTDVSTTSLDVSILTQKFVTKEEAQDYLGPAFLFYSFWNKHFKANATQVAVAFLECNTSLPMPKLNYTILYNASRALKFQQLIFGSPDKPDGRVELAYLLDSLFMSMVLDKNVTVKINTTTFPQFYQQMSVQSRQAASATLFLFCAITFQFVMMMYNIVSEKDLKLRQGLKLIGLKDSVYWLSWTITGVIIAFLSTIVLMVTGYACQLKFFLNTNILINFLLFFIYSCSMVPLAFFASVFISTVRQAVNTGMVIFVVGLMVISLLSNPFLLTQLYKYVKPLVYVLSFLPPFHLAKSMADIGIASSDLDISGLPKEPYHFGWSNMTSRQKVLTFDFSPDSTSLNATDYFYMPPTWISFACLVWNGVLYGVLAWYLDAVLRGNHGIPRKGYFFLQPSYWCDCLYNHTNQFSARRESPELQVDDGSDNDAGLGPSESTSLLRGNNQYGANYALRIQELVKTFHSSTCCCCARKHNTAVNHLSLNAQEHQILALLGHNGAGKTTTINMLIGLLEPDNGDAYFYNFSIRKDLDALRDILGVCPQHDVLWGDLTAREHMELFGNLKDIDQEQMNTEIETLLEEVQLNHVANHRVNTFSGGMKRRLSVALSFLGDPKVIFLDEPTTGMDPKIRRNIWNLILRKKQNRVTIMTTHSMEEADILGDNIVIMANGEIKVQGTSMNLKNRYAGYVIELVVRNDGVQEIEDLVRRRLPEATPKSDPIAVEGGVLLAYSLSPDSHDEIVPFFKIIERDDHIAKILQDYSISQTTLEEVFLKVTVEELFKDTSYRPVLLRSCSMTTATSPNEESRAVPTIVLPGGGAGGDGGGKKGTSDVDIKA